MALIDPAAARGLVIDFLPVFYSKLARPPNFAPPSTSFGLTCGSVCGWGRGLGGKGVIMLNHLIFWLTTNQWESNYRNDFPLIFSCLALDGGYSLLYESEYHYHRIRTYPPTVIRRNWTYRCAAAVLTVQADDLETSQKRSYLMGRST